MKTFASLFSGGGGADIGARNARFQPVQGIEIDLGIAEVYATNLRHRLCPFCRSSVSIIDSARVFGCSKGRFIYLCDRFPNCDARVECHPGSIKPLGTLANRELGRQRSLAHCHFDPLWQLKIFTSRNAAYKWLARAMGLPPQKDSCSDVRHLVVRKSNCGC